MEGTLPSFMQRSFIMLKSINLPPSAYFQHNLPSFPTGGVIILSNIIWFFIKIINYSNMVIESLIDYGVKIIITLIFPTSLVAHTLICVVPK